MRCCLSACITSSVQLWPPSFLHSLHPHLSTPLDLSITLLKRKAGSHPKKSDQDEPKKPRLVEPAARSNSSDSLEAALAHANLTPSITIQTLKLSDAIQATEGSHTQRMQAVVDLLKTDAARPASTSLLDLSLVAEGDQVGHSRRTEQSIVLVSCRRVPCSPCLCLWRVVLLCWIAVSQTCALFVLLRFFSSCCFHANDTGQMRADKTAAQQLIYFAVSLLPKLLRSFDPAIVDAATGNNALHEMCGLFWLSKPERWEYKLAEQLIARGVSVHQRSKKGRTPLMQWVFSNSTGPGNSNASGLRLLLAHGADLNAQDGDGNGVLHHLVKNGALAMLEDLLGGGGVAHLDHFLRNSASQTAVDLAAIDLALQAHSSASRHMFTKRIHRLLMTQNTSWAAHARPALQMCLEAVLPVVDLAKLTLGYIDGSGLPFTSAEEEKAYQSDAAELSLIFASPPFHDVHPHPSSYAHLSPMGQPAQPTPART